MSARLLTFGCRLNAAESETIGALAGHLDGTIIVNTCAVTAEAERQGRQAIRRAHRETPGAAIVVTGCAAEIAPTAWAGLPGVTRIVPNAHKLRPATWQAGAAQAENVAALSHRTRAFLQIQQGCDHRCTFCVIPLGRGASRSVPLPALTARAHALVASGHRELVLTGVDLTSWGADLPGRPRLGDAVLALLADIPGLERLRLSSIDPGEIDPALWQALAEEPRLMPHLHLSLQSGSALILKRMRRRHTPDQALQAIDRARRLRPGIGIGADLIAGFPTETDALFEETLAFVEAAGIPYLHVFPYSERPGTPAARMPAVPVATRRDRAAALREAGAREAARFHASLLGQTQDVLIEADGTGHAPCFAPVRGPGAPGSVLPLRITAATAAHCVGTPPAREAA